MQREIPLAINVDEGDIAGHATNINMFVEKTEGGKYSFTIQGTEGLAVYADVGYATGIMALHSIGDEETGRRDFAITRTGLFEINNDGSVTNRGSVGLSGPRVVCAHNGIQLVFVDGTRGYSFTLISNALNEIVSDGFYPARTVTFQDGYFVFDRLGTNEFFISQLQSDTFDAADFASAEGQPDNIVAVISDHRELFLFGSSSTEVWYNSGDQDFPFERSQGAFIEKGCTAPYSIQKTNNTIYFLGSDFMVYSLSGYTPVRISTHAVEQDFIGLDLTDVFAYTYAIKGHLFYVLTIPAISKTWVYDIATNVWHIRESSKFGRHVSNNCIASRGKNLVGDFQSGLIYELSFDALTDNNDEIIRQFQLPTVNLGRKISSFGSLEIDMETGIGQTNGPSQEPRAVLEFSKDKSKTWSNQKFASMGKKGKYATRVKWNRLGAARQMDFKVKISGECKLSIGGAWVEVM